MLGHCLRVGLARAYSGSMKIALIALLAFAGSASIWAGDLVNIIPTPDAGASVLLLGMGVGALGFVRRAFQR